MEDKTCFAQKNTVISNDSGFIVSTVINTHFAVKVFLHSIVLLQGVIINQLH